MNSMIGKSTGIALLMAAAILAALFAMGTFSTSGVGADTPSGSESHSHDTVILTAASSTADTGAITASLDLSGGEGAHNRTADIDPTMKRLQVTATGSNAWGANSLITAKVDGVGLTGNITQASASPPTLASGVFIVDLTDGVVSEIMITADNSSTDADAGTYTIKLSYGYSVVSDATPSAGVSLDIDWSATGNSEVVDGDDTGTGLTSPDIDFDDSIVIKLPKFGVPSSIDPDDITVGSGSNSGHPSDVVVSGTTLTLRMGNTGNSATTLKDDSAEAPNPTSIFISTRAGITNPDYANDSPTSYPITIVGPEGESADTVVGHAIVLREVSVSPKSGTRGTEMTITGKGFADGSADLMYGIGMAARPVTVSDGAFTYTVNSNDKTIDTNDDVFGPGNNAINVSDARGKMANTPGNFEVKPSFTVSPESPVPGSEVTISLKDSAVTDNSKVMVSFAGRNEREATKGSTKTSWKVQVPSGVRIGTIQFSVKVDTEAPLTQNITIGTNDLIITPSSVVPGQQITITGSGFATVATRGIASHNDDLPSVTVNNVPVADVPTDNIVTSAGRVAITITVPANVGDGTKRVVVTDDIGRVGIGTITVAKPSVTIEPTMSSPGSVVTVTGSGFDSNGRVDILYGESGSEAIEEVGRADSNGNVSVRLTIPADVASGSSNKVKVASRTEVNGVKVSISASADHKTPGPTLTVTQEVTEGGTITISGENWKGFSIIDEVKVGDQKALPSPAPETDRDGSFSFTTRVPRIGIGSHTVSVTIDKAMHTAVFNVVAVPTTAPTPSEAFADIGDRLERVWHFDAANQEWSWYDPDMEVPDTLDTVSSGMIVIVIISAGDSIEFQGKTLYAGSNFISLN